MSNESVDKSGSGRVRPKWKGMIEENLWMSVLTGADVATTSTAAVALLFSAWSSDHWCRLEEVDGGE